MNCETVFSRNGLEQGATMVHLVLTLCLMAAQQQCRDERPLLEDMSVMACMMQGQQIAQEWLRDGWLSERPQLISLRRSEGPRTG